MLEVDEPGRNAARSEVRMDDIETGQTAAPEEVELCSDSSAGNLISN